jgi:hypothetical protein
MYIGIGTVVLIVIIVLVVLMLRRRLYSPRAEDGRDSEAPRVAGSRTANA